MANIYPEVRRRISRLCQNVFRVLVASRDIDRAVFRARDELHGRNYIYQDRYLLLRFAYVAEWTCLKKL